MLSSFGKADANLPPAFDVKIISWNLLHRDGAGVDEVAGLIKRRAPDLLLMQEATLKIDQLPALVGGYYDRVVLPGRQHGLAAWSAKPLLSPGLTLALPRGVVVRRVAQILALPGVTIANVHLSHGQFLNRIQLRQIARTLPPRAAILGDCNMIGAPMLRGFSDAGPRQATHRSAGMLPLRLDRCFIRGVSCLTSETLDRAGSDHRPILVVLERDDVKWDHGMAPSYV